MRRALILSNKERLRCAQKWQEAHGHPAGQETQGPQHTPGADFPSECLAHHSKRLAWRARGPSATLRLPTCLLCQREIPFTPGSCGAAAFQRQLRFPRNGVLR